MFRVSILALAALSQCISAQFLEKPYLQLGDSSSADLTLMWHTDSTPSEWNVEVRTSKDEKWRSMAKPAGQSVEAQGEIFAHVVYRSRLTGLVPGEAFSYRVSMDSKVVFEASGQARKTSTQPHRFVLFGDCAQGTAGQRAIAYQTALAKPDFVFITGDIVYGAGRISEYRDKFFPVYNLDEADFSAGAPLLRHIPFIAAPGNHDTALNNFARFPDALAYFLYWDQPLNGPLVSGDEPKTAHALLGTPESQAVFLKGAKPRYPRMANFSFDYGSAHWTVLDSNPYMDWDVAALRYWVQSDLAAAKDAKFRFVAFHHPGFNSSKSHFQDQWMRLLAPVFEAGKVDIVFAGHVHNYQRSHPMTFAPKPQPSGARLGPKGEVNGDWTLDKAFSKKNDGIPEGVIYIVSGGGGAGLYNPEQQHQPESWQEFTHKFVSDRHTLTVVDIDGGNLRLKQVSAAGETVDSFRISK